MNAFKKKEKGEDDDDTDNKMPLSYVDQCNT